MLSKGLNQKPKDGKTEKADLLVVGADSFLGNAIIHHLKESGLAVIGTTRRRDKVSHDFAFLDFERLETNWTPPPVKSAIIAAGVTSVADCSSNPEATAKVNVEQTVALVSSLVAAGIYVVFLSSNQVFNGKNLYPRPDDPVSPSTNYGLQKAETEQRLKALGSEVAILRMTKILGHGHPLFVKWADSLRKGEVIHPFEDVFFSPAPLESAVSLARLLVSRRLGGVFHLSGDRDVSYANAARYGARALGLDEKLIKPISALQSGITGVVPEVKTAMDMESVTKTFGIFPADVEETIRTAFTEPV